MHETLTNEHYRKASAMRKNVTHRSARARLFGITALTLVGASLAACGSDNEGSSEGSGTSDSTVAVEFWHRVPEIEGAKSVDDLIAAYNEENDGADVKGTTMQGSAADSYPKIATAVASGNAPCLAQVGSERMPDLLSTDQLLDVTEYASTYEDDYLPYAWSRSTIGGATYGIPMDTAPLALMYRADIFSDLGIEPPTTWDEYRAASEKVKAANPKARLGNFPNDSYFLMSLAASNDAQWWSLEGDEGWRVDIDSAETAEVADYWQGLIDDDLTHTTPDFTPELNKQLDSGEIVSLIQPSWYAPLLAGFTPKTSGKWAVAQIPSFDGDSPVGQNGGSVVAVLKGCENPEGAVKFAHWLNSQTEDLMALGLFPATAEESLATPDSLKTFFGGQDVFKEFLIANEAAATDFAYAPAIGDALTALGDGMTNATTKGAPLADAVTDAQETSVASIDDAGITVVK